MDQYAVTEQRGLNVNARPFNPSNPRIQRRNSFNPAYTSPARPKRRNSLRTVGTATGAWGKPAPEPQQKKNSGPDLVKELAAKKKTATSFADEGFARKEEAMRAAAKKIAAQRAALQRSARFKEALTEDYAENDAAAKTTKAPEQNIRPVLGESGQVQAHSGKEDPRNKHVYTEEQKRRYAAQKGYSRRHSSKIARANSSKKPQPKRVHKSMDKENSSHHTNEERKPASLTKTTLNSSETSIEMPCKNEPALSEVASSATSSENNSPEKKPEESIESLPDVSPTPRIGTEKKRKEVKLSSVHQAALSDITSSRGSSKTNSPVQNSAPSPVVETPKLPQATSLSTEQPTLLQASSAVTEAASEDPVTPAPVTPAPETPAPQPTISQCTSTFTDIASERTATPAKSRLTVSSVTSAAITPRSQCGSAVTGSAATRSELSRVLSCSVDIATGPRMSAVSSSDSYAPGPAVEPRTRRGSMAALASGKWCESCAGVGLHISALLTELAQTRGEVAKPAPLAEPSKTGWKRMMSQTLIGDRGAARAAAEKSRLQLQVDVLTTTVSFLYEKLQSAGRAGPDVEAAFGRCCIRR